MKDKFVIILLSNNGYVQGYLKSISTYHNNIESTDNIDDAKQYSKYDTAVKNGELAAIITHGGLLYRILNV